VGGGGDTLKFETATFNCCSPFKFHSQISLQKASFHRMLNSQLSHMIVMIVSKSCPVTRLSYLNHVSLEVNSA
jgi:hypothetical protein